MSAYLDHAATTPMSPAAIEAMEPFLTSHFANPSGSHRLAREVRRRIDDARDVVADVLGAEPGDVVFTSGGTEADNLAVVGAARRRGGGVVASAVEHHAVLDPVQHLGGRLVAVDGRCLIDLDDLSASLDESVSVVSVMLVNNEVGTVQPLADVAEVVRARAPNALLHTDAIQAIGWLDVAAETAPADLVSISGHKFGGPKGVGALVVRDGAEIDPLLLGGGQERGRRSGTPNVPGIVGMAAAVRVAVSERARAVERVTKLRDRMLDGLLTSVPGLVETGVAPGAEGPARAHKVAGNAHVCIEGVESEALLFILEDRGVYASAASSCSSGAAESSHVLAAMGVPDELRRGSLRLSLGHHSTDDDIDHVLEVVPAAVERLRLFS